jgi:hypothetical protein
MLLLSTGFIALSLAKKLPNPFKKFPFKNVRKAGLAF